MKIMKVIAAGVLALGMVSGAFAQGRVSFANVGLDAQNNFFQNPFTLAAGGALLEGTGYSVELLGGVDAGSLQSLGPIISSFSAGLFSGGDRAVPGATATGSFQVRAWDNAGGTITSYAAAVAANRAVASSAVWSQAVVNVGGAPAAAMPQLPALALAVVPEPSVVALAVVGVGLALLRRKK